MTFPHSQAIRFRATALAGLVLALGACNQGSSNLPTTPTPAQATSPPATGSQSKPLRLLRMPHDISTMQATWGTLNLNDWPANRFHPIHIFGADYDNNGKLEATLMFDFLPVGTQVVAPFDGRIREVLEQPESCDTEMYLLQPVGSDDPVHPSVSLDHVLPLDAYRRPGATFKAGDVIATLGKWECKENFGRFELMVLAQTDQGIRAECPMRLLDDTVVSAVNAQVSGVMQAWNALRPRNPYPADALARGICSVPYTQP